MIRSPKKRQPVRLFSIESLNFRDLWLVGAVLCLACGGSPTSATYAGAHSAGGRAASAPAFDPRADQSLRIGGGEQCYAWLDRLGIRHQRVKPTRGMRDPVLITGPIGGIEFRSQGQTGVLCDCRMALALDWTARVLAPMGVTEIDHSGAYVYRTTRSGRPSLHARGLAIDVHAVRTPSGTFSVKRDYARGRRRCRPNDPLLNQVHCELRSLGLFRELITPDHNADHWDHLHLAISPLG